MNLPETRLSGLMADEGLARIGETSLLSRCVHLLEPGLPGWVVALEDNDAGQVFYGRREKGEVFHLDVFHQEGEIDHQAVARGVARAVDRYFGAAASGLELPGTVDLQTATGGGRANGTLEFGRKATLKKAHRTHVHIAARVPVPAIGFFLVLVDEIEGVVRSYGYDLRRIEGVERRRGGGAGTDLSDYADLGDSRLRAEAGGVKSLKSIESALVRTFRRRPARDAGCPKPVLEGRAAPDRGRRSQTKSACPYQPGLRFGGIAPAETVSRCLLRDPGGRLRIDPSDLMVRPNRSHLAFDVCLLIDSSASMAGNRIYAAKFLTRHLLHSTRDRISVLAFKGGEVSLLVPLTRRLSLVEQGLRGLIPSGLTPMAHGLSESCDYLKRARARQPLLLLITDGIPTVPKWSGNPMSDAVSAAQQVARAGVTFGCIGLEPSRPYLETIARAGKGSLYVLDDLEESSLIKIAQRELTRIK